jgi:DNA-binding protein HU-beta
MAASTRSSGKRLTQSQIIGRLSEKTGLKGPEIKVLLDDLANLAAREVIAHGEFQLPGFGKLVRSERKSREGRNPATGEAITIPAKTTLKFRLRKAMKLAALAGDSTTRSDR